MEPINMIENASKNIENISLILTTIATFFAAIATWYSYKVSQNSLDFQKNYAKNQNLINELNRIIYNAETLKILIPEPFELSDDEFESIEPLLSKLKLELKHLGARKIIVYQNLTISSIENKYDLARNNSSLEEVIDMLEGKKAETFS